MQIRIFKILSEQHGGVLESLLRRASQARIRDAKAQWVFYAPERRRRGFTARCPSLLLELRSALLPVNLASGADLTGAFSWPLRARAAEGDRMETVASVRALVSFYARKNAKSSATRR